LARPTGVAAIFWVVEVENGTDLLYLFEGDGARAMLRRVQDQSESARLEALAVIVHLSLAELLRRGRIGVAVEQPLPRGAARRCDGAERARGERPRDLESGSHASAPRRRHEGRSGRRQGDGLHDRSRSAGNADEAHLLGEELRALRLLGIRARAALSVVSEPAGAAVSVDGIALGTTLLETFVPAGHLELSVTGIGYDTVVEKLHCGAGEQIYRRHTLSTARSAAAPKPVATPLAEMPSAQDLLRRAQEHRLLREWSLAADSLKELIRRYPSGSETSSSFISLGLIQLERLDRPADALGSFERYLLATAEGPLAQEAAFGRIRSLRALGRRDAERAAIAEFLSRFPDAIQAPRVLERQRELERP
jgi:hypothetical protein